MRLSVLSALLIALLVPVCGLAQESEIKTDEPNEQHAPAGLAPAPKIPLQRNLRFVIRPTVLGLVPPAEGLNYGECFVRITQLEGNALNLHYEIKELALEGDEPARPSLTPRAAPEGTRIRRGDISATGLDSGALFQPPLLWGDGSWNADGALLWLGREHMSTLRETGYAPLRLGEPMVAGELGAALAELTTARMAAWGVAPGSARLIVQDWDAPYPAIVNGMRTVLSAIRCTDSVELADYWLLNDADHPLLLKMSFRAPGLSQLPSDTPTSAEAAATKTPQQQALELVNTGSGFAVVSIDF